MAYLSLFITVPLTVLAVLFVVSNTADVSVYVYPGSEPLTAPFYVAGLALLLGGFLAGAIFVSLHAQKTAFRYWQEKQKSARLEKDLDDLHRKVEKMEEEKVAAAAPAPAKTETPALPFRR